MRKNKVIKNCNTNNINNNNNEGCNYRLKESDNNINPKKKK